MTYEGDDKKLHPIRTISHCRVVLNADFAKSSSAFRLGIIVFSLTKTITRLNR